MVARQDQDIFGAACAQNVEILVDGIGSAGIPSIFAYTLLGRDDIDEFAQLGTQEAPALLDVPDQRVGFVLRQDTDPPDAGIQAVGERKINDAELAAKRHCWLGTPFGEIV